MSGVLSTGSTVLRGTYIGLITDAPGTVAQNVYLVIFNPATSPVITSTVELIVSAYTVGSSGTASSLLISRITGFTGGTVAAPATVPRFLTTQPNPLSQVVSNNPTITTTGTPVNANPPPISTGAGSGGTGLVSAVAPALLLPGQGVAVYTLAGNINQVWNIEVAFQEF